MNVIKVFTKEIMSEENNGGFKKVFITQNDA